MWTVTRMCWLVLVAVVALVAAACGGASIDGGEGEVEGGGVDDTNTTQAEETEARGEGSGVIDNSALPATVTYNDLEWTITDVQLTDTHPDGDEAAGDGRAFVVVEVEVDNPMTDLGFSTSSDAVVFLRPEGPDGELISEVDAISETGGATSFFELGPEESEPWTFVFDVPASVDPLSVTVQVGIPEVRPQLVSPGDGVLTGDTSVPSVDLATTSWEGEFSYNSAELDILDAFASYNAGVLPEGPARPSDGDRLRRAADDTVFVSIDYRVTEISTSSVIGINFDGPRIVADGEAVVCGNSLSRVSEETQDGYLTCSVPVDSASLELQWCTETPAGGCTEWGWTSEIDTSFLDEFEG